MLTNNRVNTFIVLIFSDLNKTQIYKTPYKDSPHHETGILMSFNYLNLFKPNECKEDYHSRGPNYKIFLFEIENKYFFYVGEKLITFETMDIIV